MRSRARLWDTETALGKAGRSEGSSPRAGSGCGGLTGRKVGLEGQLGPRNSPPRTGQNRLQPWGRDYAEPEACPAASPVLHDLTTTCLRRGRKRGNSTFFQE